MEFDYQTLIDLKKIVEKKIESYNFRIENFSANGNDEEFNELVSKAIYFRKIIQQINEELNKI